MTEQGTAPQRTISDTADQGLLHQLREGTDAAFGELFESHAPAVRRLALGMARDSSEADDITAETFFRVLQAVKRGAGPRDNVRAYLLTVARRVCWEWHGARRDVPVSDDELVYRAGMGGDGLGRHAEHSLITTAFSSLPERWRTVLWQTEVEGEQPAVVGSSFGLSANATAALARRARQGLRAAYLQAHLAVNRSSGGCRTVVEKLGGYTAGSVGGAEARRIKMHLLGCSSCRSTQAELRDVCSSLRAHAGTAVLLVPAAAVGMGAGSTHGVSTAAVSGAAGSTAGSTAGTGSGLAATLKGALLGTKLKVGMALASTAAAGAFGVGLGPVVTDSDSTTVVGLPGHRGAELSIVPQPAPGGAPPPQDDVVRPPSVEGVQPREAPEGVRPRETPARASGRAEYRPASQREDVSVSGVHSAQRPAEPAVGAVSDEPVGAHDDQPAIEQPRVMTSTPRIDGGTDSGEADSPSGEADADSNSLSGDTDSTARSLPTSSASEQPRLSRKGTSARDSSRDLSTESSRDSGTARSSGSPRGHEQRHADRSAGGELERYDTSARGDTARTSSTQQPAVVIVVDGRVLGPLLGH